jgi:hypothetical protein
VALLNYIQLATGGYKKSLVEKLKKENPENADSIEEDWVLSVFVVAISIPIALLWPFTLTYRLRQ